VIRLARRIAACLVLASPTLTTGCSVLFVSGPTKVGPGSYEPRGCTTNRAAPFIDTGLMTIAGGSTLSALRKDDADYRGMGISRDEDIGISAATLALFAVSAFYGFASVASCREAGGGQPTPYQPPETNQTRAERASEEAAEEAAVQARANEKAAADAKAAGEAARRAPAGSPAAPAPAKRPSP